MPPTITSITPATAHTGGGSLLEIVGTGYTVPTLPPLTAAPAAPPIPTVSVTFGGEPAEMVSVVDATRILVRVPRSALPITAPSHGEGPVDVVVQNLDALGDPIIGEDVTEADGLTYERPQLAAESIITRVVRQLVLDMRLQIIPNISTTTHTDYDEDPTDGLNITELADLPGIALTGPDLVENRFFSLNVQPTVPVSGEVEIRRVPYTVDLIFSVLGVSDNQVELLNMLTLTEQFFHRNKTLSLHKDPTDLNSEKVAYELEITEGGDMSTFGTPNAANIRTFSGSVLVRGVDLEDIAGFDGQQVVDKTKPFPADGDVSLSTEQIGASFPVGPSPGDC